MYQETIVRAKIWGRYRTCELLSTRGKSVSLRLLASNPGIDHLKEVWDIGLSFVHPDDRHMCVDPNFTPGAFSVTFLRDVFFWITDMQKKVKIAQGKVMHLNGCLREGDNLIIFSPKYGELPIPLNAVRIEEHAISS